MIDIVGESLRLMGGRSPLTLPALFAAGAVTSVGPCVAPRYVALAAIAQRARRPWMVALAFAAGVIGAYTMLGLCAGMLVEIRHWSSAIDIVLAVVLGASGVMTLVHDDARSGSHRHDGPRWSGSGACIGAASALVLSPCCAPVVAAVAGIGSLHARPLDAACELAAFAGGHVLPLGIAVVAGTNLPRVLEARALHHAGAVMSGTLMLAVAGFYGLLA